MVKWQEHEEHGHAALGASAPRGLLGPNEWPGGVALILGCTA